MVSPVSKPLLSPTDQKTETTHRFKILNPLAVPKIMLSAVKKIGHAVNVAVENLDCSCKNDDDCLGDPYNPYCYDGPCISVG